MLPDLRRFWHGDRGAKLVHSANPRPPSLPLPLVLLACVPLWAAETTDQRARPRAGADAPPAALRIPTEPRGFPDAENPLAASALRITHVTEKPPDCGPVPAGLKGNTGFYRIDVNEQVYQMIVDPGPPAGLYIDFDRDGDLSEENRLEGQQVKSLPRERSVETTRFGPVALPQAQNGEPAAKYPCS